MTVPVPCTLTSALHSFSLSLEVYSFEDGADSADLAHAGGHPGDWVPEEGVSGESAGVFHLL